jgi:hypothetical protein
MSFESKLIYDDWTRDLSEKAKKQGEIYHIRSYLRWMCILVCVVTLQLMNIFQIFTILAIQGGYMYFVYKDTIEKSIFQGKFFPKKYLI